MKSFGWMLIFATALLLPATAFAQDQKPPRYKDQKVFSSEDSAANHPVAIPREVLAILAKDPKIRDILEYANIPPDRVPAKWFSAAEVHLGLTEEKDLIVLGESPIRESGSFPFWVFIHDAQGYKLVLNNPTAELSVLKTVSNGYRDLKSVTGSRHSVTTVNFQFSGNKYVEVSSKTETIY